MKTRKVEPQWGVDEDGKSIGNLGSFKVQREDPSPAELLSMVQNHPAAMSEMVGGQLHIKFGGPSLKELVLKQVQIDMPKAKDETWPKYLVRTYAHARTVAAKVCPTAPIDYVQCFMYWAEHGFGQRGAKADEVVKIIRDKWATATNEKRDAFIKRFGLVGVTVMCTPQEIEAAYDAQKEDML